VHFLISKRERNSGEKVIACKKEVHKWIKY
jgi:hypothetical protein